MLLALLVQLIESVTGNAPRCLRVQMPLAEPSWLDRYAQFGFASLVFGGEPIRPRPSSPA